MPAVYFWLHEPNTELRMEVIRQTDVLDIREPVGDLTVVFQGDDIRAEKKNLRIYVVRVTNVGETDIRATDFAAEGQSEHLTSVRPWGIAVDGGDVMQVKVAQASSDYVSDTLAPMVSDKSVIALAPCILEEDKWADLEFLVLHPSASDPTITAHGKIVGIDALAVVPYSPAPVKRGVLVEAFGGRLWVQILRIVGYFVAVILLALALGMLIAGIGGAIHKRRRRRDEERFVQLIAQSGHGLDDACVNIMLRVVRESGEEGLAALLKTLRDEGALRGALLMHRLRKKTLESSEAQLDGPGPMPADPYHHPYGALLTERVAEQAIGALADSGAVEEVVGGVPKVEVQLAELVLYLSDRMNEEPGVQVEELGEPPSAPPTS